MRLNPKKSLALGDVVLFVRGHRLAQHPFVKLLGEVLATKASPLDRPTLQDAGRVAECKERWRRIATLPGNRDMKLHLVGALALPVLYGLEFTPLAYEQSRDLRRIVWQTARGGRLFPWSAAVEILFTVFAKGHLVDPVQFADYRSVHSFARLASFDAQAVADLRLVHARVVAGVEGGGVLAGPVANLWRVFVSLGWSWPEPATIRTRDGEVFQIPLPLEHRGRLGHALREALRRREVADMVSATRRGRLAPRRDMQGVEDGLRWRDCRALSVQVPDLEAGVVVQVVCGAIKTRDRLFRHGRTAEITDPRSAHEPCREADVRETHVHRWWECPRWEGLRPQWFRELRLRLRQLPACLMHCGLVPLSVPDVDAAALQGVYLSIEKSVRAAAGDPLWRVSPPGPPGDSPPPGAPPEPPGPGGAAAPSASPPPPAPQGGGRAPRRRLRRKGPDPSAAATVDGAAFEPMAAGPSAADPLAGSRGHPREASRSPTRTSVVGVAAVVRGVGTRRG